MVFYKCDKCFKEFSKKYNYEIHINRKFPCNNNIDKDLLITQLQNENMELKNENMELKEDIEVLKEEINRLKLEKEHEAKEIYKDVLEKYICTNTSTNKTSNKKVTNNTNNTNNTNSNNTINNFYNLVPFGMENIDDLTPEEKKTILNSGMFCSVMCAKKLNCNPRLPQYQNITFTNLRSNDAKIFDKDKTWKTIDKEDLFETVIPRRIDDVNLLIENEEIKISPYMENLMKKGIDEDEVVKDEKIKKRFHRTVYDFHKNNNNNIKNKTIKKQVL
jgi:hypothetical protein